MMTQSRGQVAVACLLGLFLVFAEAASRPNILFILADDLGYGEVEVVRIKLKVYKPLFRKCCL